MKVWKYKLFTITDAWYRHISLKSRGMPYVVLLLLNNWGSQFHFLDENGTKRCQNAFPLKHVLLDRACVWIPLKGHFNEVPSSIVSLSEIYDAVIWNTTTQWIDERHYSVYLSSASADHPAFSQSHDNDSGHILKLIIHWSWNRWSPPIIFSLSFLSWKLWDIFLWKGFKYCLFIYVPIPTAYTFCINGGGAVVVLNIGVQHVKTSGFSL